MIKIIIILTLTALYFDLKPSIDKTRSGWLLWYNSNGNRKYIVLWQKK